ncbi:hypothetical protein M408DRAFT_328935 [Serendipita vermifera MAFF 305830]|uniref:ATP synthase subunit H, mitochondrial n=1 Tax=Serendipita vermifera MAFF 305830 TaxID=933852 RepID=A0A0C3BCU8_SERVB|nr:hypothetical protein M408DRAFT_328935 [Serendipita vermifera MAFF 305830]
MRLLVQSTNNLARASRRCFATSSVVRKDLVQDLYIRELKAYKPAPAAKDAHVGAVREFSQPKTPAPPSVPADLASELSAYDAAEPSLAPKSADSAAAPTSTEGKLGGPALLKFLQEDLPADDHHHH